MNCDRAFASLRARIGAGLSVEDPRGARHWAHLRATDLYAVGSLILTMMQSYASAAKLRAAGPFSRSASSARFEYGFPPPRIVNSAVVLNSQRERRMVLSPMLLPFRTLDVR